MCYFLCFVILHKTRGEMYLVSSWVLHMLTIPFSLLPVLFFFLVDVFRRHIHMCLARRWWMSLHREGPKNISPSSKEQIPFLGYLAPCQTFRWTCKLSLWSPSYRWGLSNLKVHRTVGSDYDTLMVQETKTHANTPCYNNWSQTTLSQSITNKFGSIKYDCSSNFILSILFWDYRYT